MKLAVTVLAAALVACIVYIIVGAGDRVLTFVLVGLSLLAGIVALRFTVSFDLNRYFEGQREKRQRRARALCPHAEIVPLGAEDPDVGVRITYIKPSGTTQWECQICGDVTYEPMVRDCASRWEQDPEALVEQLKKFKAATDKIDG